MARPSRAALDAARSWQAPDPPPEERKRPGLAAEALTSRDKQNSTKKECEKQGQFTTTFLDLLAPEHRDPWLLPHERDDVEERRGPPPPPFDSVREEARLWARFATAEEHREYLGACWLMLPERDRAAFLKAAKRAAA